MMLNQDVEARLRWETLGTMGFRYVLVDPLTYGLLAKLLENAEVPTFLSADVVPTTGPLRIFRVTDARAAAGRPLSCDPFLNDQPDVRDPGRR